MIQHYLKIAIRNLLKYKMQTSISILGLGIGFVCFALSFYWIRYEMTYDHFRQDADRIYMVRTNEPYAEGGITSRMRYPFADYLTTHFPEIEEAVPFYLAAERVEIEGEYTDVSFSSADSAWMDLMDVQIVRGNRNFMNPQGNAEVAITEEAARQYFPGRDPIGKEIKTQRSTKTICAVVQAASVHTCFPIEMLGNPEIGRTWSYVSWRILIKVKPDVDPQALEEKIRTNLPPRLKDSVERILLTPLSELHYTKDYFSNEAAGITFRYIVYFSAVGLLIILCAIINYAGLFINRMKVRQREMALRMIHGAGLRSLVSMLTVEFVLLLLCAVFVGFVLIELFMPAFLHLTGIDASRTTFYAGTFLFIGLVSVVLLLIIVGLLCAVYRRSLHRSLHPGAGSRAGRRLRKGSIVLQLFVCLSFIGCTVLINRQLDYLRHRDLGMDFHNIGSFYVMGADYEALLAKVNALPMITAVLPPEYCPLVLRQLAIAQWDNWEGMDRKPDAPISVNLYLGKEEFFRFYRISLLTGNWLNDDSIDEDIIINETLARRMGWMPQEAVGKHIYSAYDAPYTVRGVVKDFQYVSPTLPVPPTAFVVGKEGGMMRSNAGILFKYREGTWGECRKALEQLYTAECSPDIPLTLSSEQEVYDGFLRSEDMLTRLLGFASVVCVFTALFGIYSLVMLTCEQRRKEIAIRKVNGASVGSILLLFFREYLGLLCLSALLAFPLTYAVMQRWVEGYSRQASISLYPFLVIFVGLALLIVGCIAHRVWQTANENPAEVVKSE
ncbi:MAG: ABC transporter permease [Bacteroides sp.]|nr:ABC transporter permease [Bacteroides sp.]